MATQSVMKLPGKMRAWEIKSSAGGIQKNMYINDSAQMLTSPPKSGQALIKVSSVSINPVDYKLLEIPYLSKLIAKHPVTPGKDFSGRVVSIGGTSDTVKEGDYVNGTLDPPLQHGTLAEYLTAPLSSLSAVPDDVSPDDAAAAVTTGLTAYQCIVPFVKSGDKVFINGGSGGTGTFGIQIAKLLGCHVTTSCSTANVEFCKELGADEVIDYKKVDLCQTLKSKGPIFKHVIDNVGMPFDLYWAANEFLKPDGSYAQIGGPFTLGGMWNALSRLVWPGFLGGGKRKFHFIGMQNKADQLQQLSQWMSEGKVKAVIDSSFNFEEANKAYDRLKTNRARGKIIVTVAKQ